MLNGRIIRRAVVNAGIVFFFQQAAEHFLCFDAFGKNHGFPIGAELFKNRHHLAQQLYKQLCFCVCFDIFRDKNHLLQFVIFLKRMRRIFQALRNAIKRAQDCSRGRTQQSEQAQGQIIGFHFGKCVFFGSIDICAKQIVQFLLLRRGLVFQRDKNAFGDSGIPACLRTQGAEAVSADPCGKLRIVFGLTQISVHVCFFIRKDILIDKVDQAV